MSQFANLKNFRNPSFLRYVDLQFADPVFLDLKLSQNCKYIVKSKCTYFSTCGSSLAGVYIFPLTSCTFSEFAISCLAHRWNVCGFSISTLAHLGDLRIWGSRISPRICELAIYWLIERISMSTFAKADSTDSIPSLCHSTNHTPPYLSFFFNQAD